MRNFVVQPRPVASRPSRPSAGWLLRSRSDWRTYPIVLAVGLLAAGASCKKESSTAGSSSTKVSPKDADALWALAPEGAQVGVVVTPRGLQLLEGGAQTVFDTIAKVPELAFVKAQLDGAMAEIGGPATTLADLGLDRTRGFAYFSSKTDGQVGVVPISDRAKFHARFKLGADAGPAKLGELFCKTVNTAYVCAEKEATLAKVAKGVLPKTVASVGARGDIEFSVDIDGSGAGGVVQLERGAMTIRGNVKLPEQMASMVPAPSKPRFEPGKTAAFGVADARALLSKMPPLGTLPNGTSLDDVLRTINGPFTVTVGTGTVAPDLRVPLSDPAPVASLVTTCKDFLPPQLLAPEQKPGVCSIVVPQFAMTLDMWVEGKELRVGTKGGQAVTKQVPMTAFGEELARGEWAMAFWGRGTMYNTTGFNGMPPTLPDEGKLMIRGLALLNEFGLGVRNDNGVLKFVIGGRTQFANPPELTEKLFAIPPEDIISGKTDTAAAVAKANPGSPFAKDFDAGQGGLLVPTAVIGMLAAVAVPAFMDYMKKSKKTESALQLNKLAKNLKAYAAVNSALPKVSAPLTPAKSCCEFPGARCETTAADWAVPAWQELEFMIPEPHLFRYSFESDGTKAVALAVGDLDCDGTEITYKLEATLLGNGVQVTITEPPANSD